MLSSLRQSAGSWVIKVLLGLLIVSFAVWGIGDIIRVQPETTVIRAGDERISISQFVEAYTRDLRRLQAQSGRPIDAQQARALGLVERTSDQLVSRVLYDQAVHELGIHASDQRIADQIRQDPAFRDSLGQFSRLAYENLIRQAGFTSERAFVEAVRRDLNRAQLLDAVTSGARSPQVLAERIYSYRQEKRSLSLARLPYDRAGEVAAPADAEIEAYHAEHAAAFTAPEYRTLRWLALGIQDLVSGVAIEEAEARQYYTDHGSEFGAPERRELLQMVLPDEAKAKAAADRLAAGTDFATVAKEEAGADEASLSLGEVAPQDVLPEIGAAAFQLSEGSSSAPVQSPLGWHIVLVKRIVPAQQKAFAEVRAQIEDELRQEKAATVLARMVVDVEDALAGGAGVEEVARQFNLQLGKAEAVDAEGRDREGKPVSGLPAAPEFLATAFEIGLSDEPRVTETREGSIFVVDVEAIAPAALRPLEEVRQQVIDAIVAERRRDATLKRAEALAAEVRQGRKLDELVEAAGATVTAHEPLTREAAAGQLDLSLGVLEAAYRGGEGSVVSGADGSGRAAVVAVVGAIEKADPAANAQMLNRLSELLGRSVADDLMALYRQSLATATPVHIDRHAIEAAVENQGQF